MMPPWKKYLLLGLVFFAVCLIYYFPAQLAWSLLPKQRSQLVGLYGLEGSWHSGVASSGRVLGIPVRELAWRLRPTPSAPIRVKIRFALADPGGSQSQQRFLGFSADQLLALGLKDFEGVLSYSGKKTRLLLQDRGGPLGVAAVLLVQPDRSYQLDATLTIRNSKDQVLTKILPLLGPSDKDGRIKINRVGVFPLSGGQNAPFPKQTKSLKNNGAENDEDE